MIEKYQTCSIYATCQRSSFKQLLKKTFDPSKVLIKKTLANKTRESNCRNFCELFSESYQHCSMIDSIRWKNLLILLKPWSRD